MTPKPSLVKDAAFAELRSNFTALESEYRLYRKACDRFHAIVEKRLDAMRNALAKFEKLDESEARRSTGIPRTNHNLSKREIQILKLIAEGYGTKQAAHAMGIAFKTAVGHRANLMTKLGLHDSTGLTRYAIRMGLVEA